MDRGPCGPGLATSFAGPRLNSGHALGPRGQAKATYSFGYHMRIFLRLAYAYIFKTGPCTPIVSGKQNHQPFSLHKPSRHFSVLG